MRLVQLPSVDRYDEFDMHIEAALACTPKRNILVKIEEIVYVAEGIVPGTLIFKLSLDDDKQCQTVMGSMKEYLSVRGEVACITRRSN